MLSHHSLTRENKRARHSEASRFHKIRDRRGHSTSGCTQFVLCALGVLRGLFGWGRRARFPVR